MPCPSWDQYPRKKPPGGPYLGRAPRTAQNHPACPSPARHDNRQAARCQTLGHARWTGSSQVVDRGWDDRLRKLLSRLRVVAPGHPWPSVLDALALEELAVLMIVGKRLIIRGEREHDGMLESAARDPRTMLADAGADRAACRADGDRRRSPGLRCTEGCPRVSAHHRTRARPVCGTVQLATDGGSRCCADRGGQTGLEVHGVSPRLPPMTHMCCINS